MKKIVNSKKSITVLIAIILTGVTLPVFSATYKTDNSFTKSEPFILFDFNDRTPMSNLGSNSGIFDFDPDDEEAYCRVGTDKDLELNNEGFFMKITYDVDSTKPAFNGWWIKLNRMDLTNFEAVQLTVRGDKDRGFSDIFKIELKDKNNKIYHIVEDISPEWQTIVIPFSDFIGDLNSTNFNKMEEFVIVFEDWRLKTKTGRYYIDDISFVPKEDTSITYGELINRKKQINIEIK